jgi:hypothetical protein
MSEREVSARVTGMEFSQPQCPPQGADLELEIPLLDKVPRHTRAINSCFPTSSPGRSTSAVKISSARLPARTGLSSFQVGQPER